MLRFRPNNIPPEAGEKVQLQWRPENSPQWFPLVEVPVENGKGFFTAASAAPGPGFVRAVWNGAQVPFTLSSREVKIVG
jgi:hypothetical protein